MCVCVREKRGFLLRKINNKAARTLILVYSCLCLASYFKTFKCTSSSYKDTFIFGVFSSCLICLTPFCVFLRTTWEDGFVCVGRGGGREDHNGGTGECVFVCAGVCEGLGKRGGKVGGKRMRETEGAFSICCLAEMLHLFGCHTG